MATLPLELIDKIFLANPNKIISTYLAFSNKYNTDNALLTNPTGLGNTLLTNPTGLGNTDNANCNKRMKLNIAENTASNKDIQQNEDTIKYILNNDTYMRYYKQSSWLRYFMLLDVSHPPKKQIQHQKQNHIQQNKTNASRVRPRAISKSNCISNNISEPIKLIASYFNQLETY